MTSCCRARSAEEMFTARTARSDLRRYRERGLGRLERRVVELATAGGLEGSCVLEIGGGIGAVQSELLAAGAERGEIVELVDGYREYAYELAREKGLEGRVSFLVGDVLDAGETVAAAELVVLDRVVCCSPEGIELTSAAARLTRRSLFLIYPRDVVWVRVGVRLLNAGFWLVRRSFRTFAHPPALLLGAAEREGLALVERRSDRFWELAVLARS